MFVQTYYSPCLCSELQVKEKKELYSLFMNESEDRRNILFEKKVKEKISVESGSEDDIIIIENFNEKQEVKQPTDVKIEEKKVTKETEPKKQADPPKSRWSTFYSADKDKNKNKDL
jgi:hypothetical protein